MNQSAVPSNSLLAGIRYFLLLAGGILFPTHTVSAIDSIRISLGDVQGSGWSAQQVSAQLRMDINHSGELVLEASRMRLPDPVGLIKLPTIRCTDFRIKPAMLQCMQGELRGQTSLLGEINGRLQFKYQSDTGSLEFSVTSMPVASGTASLQGESSAGSWKLALQGRSLQLDALLKLASVLGYKTDYQATGTASIDIHSQGVEARPKRVQISARLSGVNFSDSAGIHAGEGLALQAKADLKWSGGQWIVKSELQGDQGQLYIDPLFLEIKGEPVHLRLATRWSPGQQALNIESFQWVHPGVINSAGALRVRLSPELSVTDFDLQIKDGKLAGLYDTYIKPWLLGSMGGDLDATGELAGRIRYKDSELQSLELQLGSVAISDQLGRIRLDGLNGDIDWGADNSERHSILSWHRAGLFKVDIGASRLPIISRGKDFELAEKVSIPILDGALWINQWTMHHPGSSDMRWNFDGLLAPISMGALTRALKWPELSGKLSGMIPGVSYDSGELKVGGVLLIRAFDGEITVNNLVLSQPFSVVPRLQADMEVKSLDLETLTRTFSFGKIEGRLGGHVRALRLEQWRPVAFDAELTTQSGGKSRRRISQRALDNLSSIGGGVGGALSRSFLRMFEDFPYHSLGIRCRLQVGVCEMGGVAPASAGGYYIVKGSFLPPRVDVIGFSDKVDWDTLVQQLVEATTGEGSPTIQ